MINLIERILLMIDNQFTLTTLKQELENYNLCHGQSDKVDDLAVDILLPLVDILIDQDRQIKELKKEVDKKSYSNIINI